MRETSACGLAPRIQAVLVATMVPRLNWHAVGPGVVNSSKYEGIAQSYSPRRTTNAQTHHY
jgi:hypothetical protein